PRAVRDPRTPGAAALGRLARRALRPGLVRRQLGRHDEALDQRPREVDAPPRDPAAGASPLRDPVLPGPPPRHCDRTPDYLPGPRQSPALPPDHVRGLPHVVVRRQLQRRGAGRAARLRPYWTESLGRDYHRESENGPTTTVPTPRSVP